MSHMRSWNCASYSVKRCFVLRLMSFPQVSPEDVRAWLLCGLLEEDDEVKGVREKMNQCTAANGTYWMT